MTSFKATVRTDTVDGVGQRRGCCVPPKKLFFGGTQHRLVRGRKKGKKRERETSQDEPALEKGERQLKSAKIEIVSCREENYRFLQERRSRKRRRREEKEKKGTRTGIELAAAAPSQPTRLDVSRSDHSAASKETAS